MDNLGLTWFDFATLIVLAMSGVMAFARGLIREVFSIVAFIGAAIAGVFFSPMFQGLVEGASPLSGAPARLAAGVAIFLIVYIAVTVITSAVAKTVHQSTEIGSFDRAAGLAFGILRGILIGSLLVLLLRNTTENSANPRDTMPESIVNARTYPLFETVAVQLEKILPRAKERVLESIEQHSKSGSAPIPPEGGDQSQSTSAQPAAGGNAN